LHINYAVFVELYRGREARLSFLSTVK